MTTGFGYNLRDGDWVRLRQILQQLSSYKLGPTANPVFNDVEVSGGLTIEGGLTVSGGITGLEWGDIGGTLSDQTDLQTILEDIDVKYLDKDTAQDVIVGCLVDAVDGKTPLTDDAELVEADITCAIYKGATRSTITLSSSNFIHQADGYWKLSLTASHTDTAGYLLITLRDDDVMLPYSERFVIK